MYATWRIGRSAVEALALQLRTSALAAFARAALIGRMAYGSTRVAEAGAATFYSDTMRRCWERRTAS